MKYLLKSRYKSLNRSSIILCHEVDGLCAVLASSWEDNEGNALPSSLD